MTRTRMILAAAFVALAAAVGALGLASGLSVKRSVAWNGEAESLDSLVEGWASEPAIPGVLLYIQKGDAVVYAGAAGSVRKEGGAPVTPETPFRTASVGKLFTAATVLRLYEQGRLDIDAPVADYLDEKTLRGIVVVDGVDYWDQFTVRQLLAHRAGVGSVDSDPLSFIGLLYQPWKRRSPADLARWGRGVTPAGRPGEVSAYSSTGYNLLGLVVEAVTGEPFHTTVRREVLDRLAMSHTFEAVHEWTGAPPMLHPYIGWFDMALYHPGFEFADGGYVTTAPDLAAFGLAIARGELFDRAETAALFIPPMTDDEGGEGVQALGPFVARTPGGARVAQHTGFWGVYFGVYPDDETVAVFTFAQLNGELWDFWDEARRLGVAQGYLPG